MNVIISNKYQPMLQTLNIDVIKSLNGVFDVEEIISQFQNFFFQRMILDITALKNYTDIKTLQKLSISLDMDKIILLLDDNDESGNPTYLSKLISMGIYNFTKNVEGIMYLYNNPNTYRDVAQYHQLDNVVVEQQVIERFEPARGVRVIALKNITKQSGATTLIYMMKKQLEKNYDVVAIEVDKTEFAFFRDKSLVSTTSENVGLEVAKYNNKDIILLDVNMSASALSLAHEVVYLIEPSILKLNRLMAIEPQRLQEIKGQKLLLNQSLLSSKDVLDFEYEARVKVFFNMPPLDERERNIQILNTFLVKLGFDRQRDGQVEKKNKILGLF